VVDPQPALAPSAPLPPSPQGIPIFTSEGAIPRLPIPFVRPADAAARPAPQPALLAVGRGFGHGVGMSQWGALALARRGENHERILGHYYRGTVLRPFGQP
jgi:stage II sporulation protein D